MNEKLLELPESMDSKKLTGAGNTMVEAIRLTLPGSPDSIQKLNVLSDLTFNRLLYSHEKTRVMMRYPLLSTVGHVNPGTLHYPTSRFWTFIKVLIHIDALKQRGIEITPAVIAQLVPRPDTGLFIKYDGSDIM